MRPGSRSSRSATATGSAARSFNYGFSGVDEFELLEVAVQPSPSRPRIAVLLLPGIGRKEDLEAAADIGASVARIATHCTEADIAHQHIALAKDLGMEAIGFLMMAHMIEPDRAARPGPSHGGVRGADCVYVVDSAGAMTLDDVRAAGRRAEGGSRLAQWGSTRTTTCRSPSPTRSAPWRRERPDRRLHHAGWEPAPATAPPKLSWPCAIDAADRPASTRCALDRRRRGRVRPHPPRSGRARPRRRCCSATPASTGRSSCTPNAPRRAIGVDAGHPARGRSAQARRRPGGHDHRHCCRAGRPTCSLRNDGSGGPDADT